MTETIEPMAAQIDQQQLAQELVEKARAEVVELALRISWPDGRAGQEGCVRDGDGPGAAKAWQPTTDYSRTSATRAADARLMPALVWPFAVHSAL